MSDVQILFAILGALYAWECGCWLRRGGVAFTTWTGKVWRAQHPAALVGNQSGGFVGATPLPPLGEIFCAYQLPFSLGPEGVLFFVASQVNPGWRPPQSGHFLRWDQISKIRCRGKKICLDQQTLFTAPTVTLADQLRTTLVRIAGLPVDQRAAAITATLADSLNTRAMEQRLLEFRKRARSLRLLANGLFALGFVLAPLLIWGLGLSRVWLGLLIGILTLTITMATIFNRLHRHFYPAATDERFTQTLILALAPASTMRARDVASRALLENFHPLAAAKVLLPAAAFRHFASRYLRDLRNPVLPHCPHSQPEASATEAFFRRALLEVVESWLTQMQIAPAELCPPPVPADASCRAYCPRCEAQFTTAAGHCADCGGLALVSFTKVS